MIPGKEDAIIGRIVAVCRSEQKGTRKAAVGRAYFKENWGMENDAHAGEGHRQVSLLAFESLKKQRELLKSRRLRSPLPDLQPGDFAENLATEGIDLPRLPIGTKLQVGESAVLEVTQIGKECHSGCEIKRLSGDCIMPREGIFARVLAGGWIASGDPIVIRKRPTA